MSDQHPPNQSPEQSGGQIPEIRLVNLSPDQLSDAQRSIIDSFISVYTELNQLATQKAKTVPNRPPINLLRKIETALCRRDDLEDQHAPIGVIVEPIYRSGIAQELMITIGSLRAGTFQPQTWISSSGEIEL